MRRDDSGQATVEFVIVAVAFLAVSLGLGVLGHAIGKGVAVDAANEHGAYSIDASKEAVRYVSLF
ncbi:MAG: TadE/TadG family type IV pilus assembly protein [Coriobacteriales bacterium]|jgi:Flp pilus assembly protein TadG